jgi:uncharacterized protein with HEPN domain
MRGKIGDRVRINHIIDAIKEVEIYIFDADYETFINNSMMRFACIKQVEIIGEACTHITPSLKNKFPDIQWNQIKGMRNIFVHEYFGIDSTVLWEIVKFDLQDLKSKMVKIEKIV